MANLGRPPVDAFKRFEAKVQPQGGCHIWLGHTDRDGYGQFFYSGRMRRATHYALTLLLGRAIDAPVVRHSCDNTQCVNPYHLIEGTHQENSNDAVARGRTLKGNNHPNSKLTYSQVSEIRLLKGIHTSRDVGLLYGVSHRTILNIWNDITWV